MRKIEMSNSLSKKIPWQFRDRHWREWLTIKIRCWCLREKNSKRNRGGKDKKKGKNRDRCKWLRRGKEKRRGRSLGKSSLWNKATSIILPLTKYATLSKTKSRPNKVLSQIKRYTVTFWAAITSINKTEH